MQPARVLGQIVVVAGRDKRLAALAADLLAAGALVAFVDDNRSLPDAPVSVRADPADERVWARVAPHVEQRLGPIDVVITDDACARVVEPVFAADLLRRGRPPVRVLAADDDPGELLSALRSTR